jgi:putative ABC transport system permease protein
MDELFGAPISSIIITLLVIFAVIALFLALIAIRDFILVKMAARNVIRRPARTGLIVFGLMLATAIISIAFTTGDSLTFSIKKVATESLRSLDETIRVDDESDVWEGKAVPEDFSETIFAGIAPILDADPDIDAVVPALVQQVAVINPKTNLFEVNSLLTGVDPQRAQRLEALTDSRGTPVDLASLGPNEVYLERAGADAIGARPGDVIQVALGPGGLTSVTVKEIADGWYFKRQGTKLVIMMPLVTVQEALEKQGLLSSILISNHGGAVEGVELSQAIVEQHGELSTIKDAGLELFPLKQTVVDEANEAGTLFVSFFTTFGLFSIGVGLLLIFLIFSMLAAERKSEMGMARAVGMQRRHLVRMFMAEGAIYGLGSAVVGAIIGMGLGVLLVKVASALFSDLSDADDFTLTAHIEPTSVLVAFLAGSILTLVTVGFASWRISKLNIVKAIRDIPDVQPVRAGRRTLVLGIALTIIGLLALVSGYSSAQSTAFGLGVSLVLIGVGMVLRWFGVVQRWVLTIVGALLMLYWLLPPSIYNKIKDDWNQDFSIFFISSFLAVIGAVLVIINNSSITLGIMVGTIGRVRRLAPIVRSAVAYPLRFGFRTGLSMVMFAVVVLSVTVMAVLIEGFTKLFDDQARLGGGYEVVGFAGNDLNPIQDLATTVEGNPDLGFVSRMDGRPSVGTLRSVFQAEGALPSVDSNDFKGVTVNGVGDDFVASNEFGFTLATAEYTVDGEVDAERLWRDLREKPGLAVANAFMLPARNNFAFEEQSDRLRLNVEGLYRENVTMEPVEVTVKDLKSGKSFTLTVVGVLDEFASQGLLPNGLYASDRLFQTELDRAVNPTHVFFNVEPSTPDANKHIKAALFQHSVETIDIAETIDQVQSAQRGIFNLLIAFMLLGLVVGIVALGVISARAVVERRHEIGVLRAVGFSRGMIRWTFLAESSFIGIMGIALGLGLGLLVSVNVMADIRTDEPNAQLVIPWLKLALIGVGAYVFSLVTTVLPAQRASRISPATALRYE